MLMSRYAIFRYEVRDHRENELAPNQHIAAFEAVRGERAPYRVRDPETHDYKNFIFDIVSGKIDGANFFSFGVGYQITERVEHRLDPETEKVSFVPISADDMRFTRAVIVPELSMAAFRDGSGDSLSATGGVGRVRAIFEIYYDGALEFELTAKQSDVNIAMRKLKLVEMKFEVTPFNPHPANPGQKLHDLLKKADSGRLTATAKPHEGGRMKPEAGGLVSEVQGMSERGHGVYGIKAETDAGAIISYKKANLKGDKDKDQPEADQPKQLYVSVPKGDEQTTEEKKIAKALMEFSEDE